MGEGVSGKMAPDFDEPTLIALWRKLIKVLAKRKTLWHKSVIMKGIG